MTPPPTPDTGTAAATDHGVHSEVGRLRKVLVCSPGLAHRRLTDVVGQTQRANGTILLLFALTWAGGNQAIGFDHQ